MEINSEDLYITLRQPQVISIKILHLKYDKDIKVNISAAQAFS